MERQNADEQKEVNEWSEVINITSYDQYKQQVTAMIKLKRAQFAHCFWLK